jgi:hypothetical protein
MLMHNRTKFTQKFAEIQENDLHIIKAMTNIQTRIDTQGTGNLSVGGFLTDTIYVKAVISSLFQENGLTFKFFGIIMFLESKRLFSLASSTELVRVR